MDYLDQIDKMSLSQLLDFVDFRNSYKEMMESAENIITKNEMDYEYEREEKQLEYLERKG